MQHFILSVFALVSFSVFSQNPEDEPILTIPINSVEEAPIYPSCANAKGNTERTKCMNKGISEFISLNFNTQIATQLGLKGLQKIQVVFHIDENGSIIEAKARAPHPDLENEMIKIVNLLPKMTPAIQNGKPVRVPYAFPAVFMAEEPIINKNLINGTTDEVAFAVVETVPVYPGCEKLLGNAAQKNCMASNISEFVSRKFNTNLAKEYGLEGRQRINVIFKIDPTGNIVDVRARSDEKVLENEAIRVVNLLPKMKPGIQRGKAVTVPYSLPIVFSVAKNKPKNNYSIPSARDF